MSDTYVNPKPGVGAWVLGVIMGVLALLGLIYASATHDGAMYVVGLIVFIVNTISIFIVIGRCVGRHVATDTGEH